MEVRMKNFSRYFILFFSLLSTFYFLNCGNVKNLKYSFAHPVLNHPPIKIYPRVFKETPEKGEKNETQIIMKDSSTALKYERRSVVEKKIEPAERSSNTSLVVKNQDKKEEIVKSAKRLIGIKDSFDSRSFIAHILRVNNINLIEKENEEFSTNLFSLLKNKGKIHYNEIPQRGDIVFLNGNIEGIVEDVKENGSVIFIAYIAREVSRFRMNLKTPQKTKDNSLIPVKKNREQKLASQIFLGFGKVVD